MAFAQDVNSPVIRKIAGAVTEVGAGKTGVCKLPTGATYLEVILECKIGAGWATRANLEAFLGTVRGTVSGTEKWSMSGKELIAISEFYRTGCVGDTGLLVIPFESLWMSELGAKLTPAYGTAGESSFQIEFTQDGASTIDSVTCWVRIASKAEALGAHKRFVRLSPSIVGTGAYDFLDLPKRPQEALSAVHLYYGANPGYLTNVAYIADNVRLIDVAPNVLNQLYLLSDPHRTPQTAKGFIHLDFTMRGLMGDAIPLTMADHRLELTHSTAPGQISIIAELWTPEPTQAGAAA
jgi:hypothetical protein